MKRFYHPVECTKVSAPAPLLGQSPQTPTAYPPTPNPGYAIAAVRRDSPYKQMSISTIRILRYQWPISDTKQWERDPLSHVFLPTGAWLNVERVCINFVAMYIIHRTANKWQYRTKASYPSEIKRCHIANVGITWPIDNQSRCTTQEVWHFVQLQVCN